MAFGYQSEDIARVQSMERSLIGHEPGLGKTRISLLSAEGRTLVIAPAIAESTWTEEHLRWTPALDLTFVSYSYLCDRGLSKRGRRELVLPKARPQYRGFDTIICDEAHYLKGRNTNWTKAVMSLALSVDKLMLVTGTPIVNWATDLWTLLKMLHPGDPRFSSYWRWVDRWFKVWQPPWGGRQVGDLQDRWSWDEFYWENLGTLYVHRKRSDVLKDLPPLTMQTIDVEMTSSQRKLYEALKKDYIAWGEGGQEVSAWSDGGLHTKLSQITTGLELVVPGMATSPLAGSGKLLAYQDLLMARTFPLVTFVQYRATAKLCQQICRELKLRSLVIDGETPPTVRMDRIHRFQRGEADVLIGTLGTMAESINLQVADTAIFVEQSWRPSTNEQAIRRLHRIGQKRPVTGIILRTKNSIDTAMAKALAEKTDEQVAALRAGDLVALLQFAA